MALGGNAQSVLVLDDNRFQQQVLRMILLGLGVRQVAVAKDVDEALQVGHRALETHQLRPPLWRASPPPRARWRTSSSPRTALA